MKILIMLTEGSGDRPLRQIIHLRIFLLCWYCIDLYKSSLFSDGDFSLQYGQGAPDTSAVRVGVVVSLSAADCHL